LIKTGAQPAFCPIPLHSHSDRASCDNPNADMLKIVPSSDENNERVRI
jgi:hypothetical protein